ncbi:hypothetical protein ACFYWP_40320 [Actinacidiphila glaucinigra]|uniref:hypothetical protein n=1 Tax=Actinacidiphila glaucinigra TaxID=235986 RepID=UPI00369E8A3E
MVNIFSGEAEEGSYSMNRHVNDISSIEMPLSAGKIIGMIPRTLGERLASLADVGELGFLARFLAEELIRPGHAGKSELLGLTRARRGSPV